MAVDDVDKAADWYGKHFGFRRIRSDRVNDQNVDGTNAPLYRIYGESLRKVKIAWLSTGNSVGFEIFQFIDPPTDSAETILKDWTLQNQYQRGGVFHVAVTAPDPEAVARRACEDGAVQIGETVTVGDDERAVYLRDPWGIVMEVLSCSYDQLMANQG